jgi:hypothetical protein
MRLLNKTQMLLSALAVLIVSLFASMPFGLAQSGTNVTGIIAQDTTWMLSGSPYTLTGNTLVDQGVKLTIQPGVTVNLGSYYIRVNGTLNAKGTASEKIIFNSGQISFTASANGWNEQTSSGCIIENSIINQTSFFNSNPIKIDSCIIISQITVASSIISNNIVTGSINSQSLIPAIGQINPPVDTSVISSNTVYGNIVLGSVSLGAVTAPSEACIVSNNIVYGSIISSSPQGTPQIFNNTVSTGGIGCTGYGSIFNNYVYGCQNGISLYTVRVFGGNLPCFATVESNIAVGNSIGVKISLSDVHGGALPTPTVQENAILGNSIGISLSVSGYTTAPIIQNNNLQNNSNYNFYLSAPNNVNVTYNWWGTVDQQAINQTIYDFKNDFNLGTVTYVPFLTAPNPQAPSVNTPIPTPTPSVSPSTPSPSASQTPAPSPTVPEISWLAILPLFAVMLFVVVKFRHQKTLNQTN